jgi:hypothetical protein
MRLIGKVAYLLAGLAALAGAGCSQAETIREGKKGQFVTSTLRALPIHAGGRVVPDGRDYRYRWPGVYFETAFRGTRVALRLDDPGIGYRLLVDDRPPTPILNPTNAEIEVAGLTAGAHRVRLEKVSEGERRPGRFGGFFAAKDVVPLPVKPRAQQIEYIGDSSMTGFGLRAPGPKCAPGEAQTYADTQAAYPVLIAKRLDADYQVNAITGRGLIRNFGTRAPDMTLSRLYPLALRDEGPAYRDPVWRPQLYVISLLADFVTAPRPGEPWTSMEAIAADYVRAFGTLAAELHRRSPDAALAIGWPALGAVPQGGGRGMLQHLREGTLAAAREAGIKRVGVYEIDVRGLERTGCGQHYSAADQQKLAGEIYGQLAGQGLLPAR